MFITIFQFAFVTSLFLETGVVKTRGVSILLVVFYIQLSNEKTLVVPGITKKKHYQDPY